jgi:uncharacterized protein (DUF305 family)
MSKTMRRSACGAAAVALGLLPAACGARQTGTGPRIVQPGAPGQPSRPVGDAPATAPRHTEADVRFMRGMIAHHAQALEMTALLRTRTANSQMKLLAQRIDVSQTDEIKLMRQWLQSRGLPAPDDHAHHAPGAAPMPGMLSLAEMEKLAAATGPEFDRLFLESMIRHHEGALLMVRQLFESPGAGQDADIFAFASDVEADQQAEIGRMRGMLREREE